MSGFQELNIWEMIFRSTLKSAATKQDVKADCTLPKYMPTELISDGKIVIKNLIQLNLTEEWLHHKLKKKNVNNIEDVYFAQILENVSLYISLKNGNTVSGSGGG